MISFVYWILISICHCISIQIKKEPAPKSEDETAAKSRYENIFRTTTQATSRNTSRSTRATFMPKKSGSRVPDESTLEHAKAGASMHLVEAFEKLQTPQKKHRNKARSIKVESEVCFPS